MYQATKTRKRSEVNSIRENFKTLLIFHYSDQNRIRFFSIDRSSVGEKL